MLRGKFPDAADQQRITKFLALLADFGSDAAQTSATMFFRLKVQCQASLSLSLSLLNSLFA